jgi:hypothetical protein
MSKAYCGIGAVPRKKSRGTAKECVEKNQVRYWGAEKLDRKTLKSLISAKNLEDMLFKLKSVEFAIKAALKKYKTMKEKTKVERKAKREEKKKLKLKIDEFRKMKEDYEDLKKKAK